MTAILTTKQFQLAIVVEFRSCVTFKKIFDLCEHRCRCREEISHCVGILDSDVVKNWVFGWRWYDWYVAVEEGAFVFTLNRDEVTNERAKSKIIILALRAADLAKKYTNAGCASALMSFGLRRRQTCYGFLCHSSRHFDILDSAREFFLMGL